MSTPLHENVSYLPVQGASQSSISVNDLEHQGIRYVRIQWVDLMNKIRYRVLPLAYFKKLAGLSRPGLSMPKVTLGLVFLTLAEGFRHVFDINLNANDHTDKSSSVQPESGSMLLTYLRSGYAHMLLDMSA